MEDIAAGQFVLELAGEVRSSRNPASEVRLGSSTESYALDMSEVGNLGAFVREQQEGNCRVVRVWTEHRDPRMSRIAVFAKGEVRAGEKLTVNAKEWRGDRRVIWSVTIHMSNDDNGTIAHPLFHSNVY